MLETLLVVGKCLLCTCNEQTVRAVAVVGYRTDDVEDENNMIKKIDQQWL